MEKLEPSYTAGGNVKWCSSFGKQSGTELPYNPTIPFLDLCSRKVKTYVHTKTCAYMFKAALFIKAQKWKQPKCPSTSEWVNKMWYICKMEYYWTIKMNLSTDIIRNLENILLGE